MKFQVSKSATSELIRRRPRGKWNIPQVLKEFAYVKTVCFIDPFYHNHNNRIIQITTATTIGLFASFSLVRTSLSAWDKPKLMPNFDFDALLLDFMEVDVRRERHFKIFSLKFLLIDKYNLQNSTCYRPLTNAVLQGCEIKSGWTSVLEK